MSPSKWRFCLCLVGFLVIEMLVFFRAERYYGKMLVGWDPQFYYAAARSLVVDADLDISNDLTVTPHQQPLMGSAGEPLGAVPRGDDGRVRNKYPLGLSLLEMPWLVLGRAIRTAKERVTGTSDAAPAGYSRLEITTTGIGLMLYSATGLTLLVALVTSCTGTFAGAVVAVAATWLGTSLFYYTAMFPFMAHGSAFTLVVLTIWLTRRLSEREEPARILWIALATSAGLLFLVRPQQVLLVGFVLPSLWRKLLRPEERGWVILAGLWFVGIGTLLPLANAVQIGRFTMNAYAAGGEGFHWFAPRFDIVLWSPSRGLLWISPVVIVAIIGFVVGRGWNIPTGSILALHAWTQLYLIAAWSSPEQGDAFGARMWCEATPLVALGLVLLFRATRSWLRGLALAGTMLSICWTCLVLATYLKTMDVRPNSYPEVIARVRGLLP